ncbi:TetR/AcrR family transcriptional regulator [Fertoebacter nigrum]|uniref:TetR/AcrR family transcriptional regulator n=2 Tax=Fertoeibacter niger TaxID=2656921 RepID=A0A8X8GY65_9RHOB|nr:TetR/AcrR family transcriptional regulator [Fertoeibacter niger]NUB46464.1 TetR/AcrR family transcriptional regulator [Fertoeibacter niger]
MHKAERPTPSPLPPDRGRGRPRSFDYDAALTAATRVFWTKGYTASSVSDLTAAMGIGSPSLYAAFGSKDALYAEAIRHYQEKYEALVWEKFNAAATAREAVESLLRDSAAALTGSLLDIPRGCMVTLSSVSSEGNAELGEIVKAARAGLGARLRARFDRAVHEGELPPSADTVALARFVQMVQNGMSILARDNVSRAELEAAVDVALAGWDAATGKGA